MIERIRIEGFKSIWSADLELGQVNCFIGANGVGKSNVLEAIGVLSAAAKGEVDDEALLRRGVRPGLPRLYKSSFKTEDTPVHIGLSAIGSGGETYRISLLNPLENPNPAWKFKTEMLTDGTDEILSDGVRNKKNLTPTTGLAALKLADLDPGNRASRLLRLLQGYAIYSPNTPTLRAMVTDSQLRSPVGLSGGGLARGFEEFRKHLAGRSEALSESIFSLIDWIDDIDTTNAASSMLSPSAARAEIVLKFTDRFMKKDRNTLTAYDASEGALYVLFCAMLCLSPQAPRFLAIDNLDQALNPRLAASLAGRLGTWLREANGEGRQLLFTAHNPAVLDGLDLADDSIRLFAVDRNAAGQTTLHRIVPSERLRELNRDYPLSRLWIMGHLGAVPDV